MQPNRPDRAMHGYIYYRWTSAYMAAVRFFLDHPGPFRALRDPVARWLEKTHHAKVVTTEDAKRVLTLNTPVDFRGLEHVVPYPVARDIVLDAPTTIALAECACRAVAKSHGEYDGHCGPVESCLYLGDPIASFVVEKQPETSRLISVEEALRVIEEAASRGNMHSLWFKDAAAGRMYAICNCCSCCCIGLKAEREGFSPLASSGFVAEVNGDACTGCGACVAACPFDAMSTGDACSAVDSDACLGCGVCVGVCPDDAVALVRHGDVEPVPWSGATGA
jgi:ferredoxin